MNVREIIKLAKWKTNTSDAGGNYDQDNILIQLNIVYKEVWRKIATGTKGYFRQQWLTDIHEGQNEYTLDHTKEKGMRKLLGVEVKSGNSYQSLKSLNENDISLGKSGYILRDNSVFIYPIPQKEIGDGLRYIGIQTIPDLTLNDDEDKIFPGHPQLREIHKILISGLMVELREGKEDFDRADRERNKFIGLMQDIISDLMNRDTSSAYTSLEY